MSLPRHLRRNARLATTANLKRFPVTEILDHITTVPQDAFPRRNFDYLDISFFPAKSDFCVSPDQPHPTERYPIGSFAPQKCL